jgi:hypothetical protein
MVIDYAFQSTIPTLELELDTGRRVRALVIDLLEEAAARLVATTADGLADSTSKLDAVTQRRAV